MWCRRSWKQTTQHKSLRDKQNRDSCNEQYISRNNSTSIYNTPWIPINCPLQISIEQRPDQFLVDVIAFNIQHYRVNIAFTKAEHDSKLNWVGGAEY